MTHKQLADLCTYYAKVQNSDKYTDEEKRDMAVELASGTMEYFGWTVYPDGTYTRKLEYNE